jgi:hypothetical protein
MAARPVPPALKALQASLRKAREPVLRARLSEAIARVRFLYATPEGRRRALSEDRGDMKRRRAVPLRPVSPGALSVKQTARGVAEAYAKEWREKIAFAERDT